MTVRAIVENLVFVSNGALSEAEVQLLYLTIIMIRLANASVYGAAISSNMKGYLEMGNKT